MSKANSHILKLTALSLFILVGGVAIYVGASSWMNSPHTKNIEPPSPAKIEETWIETSKKSIPAVADETPTASKTLYIDNAMATTEAAPNLALRGTVNWGTESAQAIIEDLNEQKQKLYKTGDVIREGIITRIMRRRVIVNWKGKEVVLTMATISDFENRKKRTVTVDRSKLNDAFRDINSLIAQISIKPHISKDGIGGLQVEDIVPGSLADSLGFIDGDIIQEINGSKIQRPRMLAAIYSGMKFLPKDVFSTEGLGSKAGSILLNINDRADGVAHEVSKVYQKMESGEDIPVLFTRNGNIQTTIFRVGN